MAFFFRILPQQFSLAQLRHPPSVGALYVLSLWRHYAPVSGSPRRGSAFTIRSNITRPLAGRAGRQRPLARVANVPLTTPWPACADNQPTSPLLADDLADPPLANPHPTASSLSRGDLPPNPPNGAPAQWPMPMPGPQGSQPPPTPSPAPKGRAN